MNGGRAVVYISFPEYKAATVRNILMLLDTIIEQGNEGRRMQ